MPRQSVMRVIKHCYCNTLSCLRLILRKGLQKTHDDNLAPQVCLSLPLRSPTKNIMPAVNLLAVLVLILSGQNKADRPLHTVDVTSLPMRASRLTRRTGRGTDLLSVYSKNESRDFRPTPMAPATVMMPMKLATAPTAIRITGSAVYSHRVQA